MGARTVRQRTPGKPYHMPIGFARILFFDVYPVKTVQRRIADYCIRIEVAGIGACNRCVYVVEVECRKDFAGVILGGTGRPPGP